MERDQLVRFLRATHSECEANGNNCYGCWAWVVYTQSMDRQTHAGIHNYGNGKIMYSICACVHNHDLVMAPYCNGHLLHMQSLTVASLSVQSNCHNTQFHWSCPLEYEVGWKLIHHFLPYTIHYCHTLFGVVTDCFLLAVKQEFISD